MKPKKDKTPMPTQPVMCGSCIFREDGQKRIVTPERMADILEYTIQGVPHICHYPAAHGRFEKDEERGCRGARNYLLMIWHRIGLIPEPTDEALETERQRQLTISRANSNLTDTKEN